MPRDSSAPSSSPWRTLLAISWADRFLLLETIVWLGIARVAVLLVPFKRLSTRLGQAMAETPSTDDDSRRDSLRRIRWALDVMSRRAPWRCKCLERGIAGKMMLRRRGVPNTLYLGIARSSDPARHALDAHAWLRSGSYFVTGGEDHDRYTVVSTFAHHGGVRG